MMLLEHHAKEFLAERGLPVPRGRAVRRDEIDAIARDAAPAVVKAQVPVGGRGKAGGIRVARDDAAIATALRELIGTTIKGHQIRLCRVEALVDFVAEAYLSFIIDAGRGQVRVLMSGQGGVDIEDESARAHVESRTVDADPAALEQAVESLGAAMPETVRPQLRGAGMALAKVFLDTEAVLLEINPLFVLRNGDWIIGDTKLVADENAIPRLPWLKTLIETNPDLYPEPALKLEQGFDFVRLDADGDIGLLTTGAGLSMQLVDELVARGHRPFNFCDIRTGQFRGDPARLIKALGWIAEGKSVRSVLVNFFAGQTDLGEISQLLITALRAVPQLRVPVTVRMIGRGLAQALVVIKEAGDPVAVETDLERAIDRAIAHARAG